MSANLGNLFRPHAAEDHPAIIELRANDETRITYRDLDAACDAVARGLLERGLRRGDRVAIAGLNGIRWIQTMFGILRAGCVAVPVNATLPAESALAIYRNAGARLTFVDETCAHLTTDALPSLRLEGAEYEQMLRPGAFEPPEPADDEPAMILYTSGSTGEPKGVLLSHRGPLWVLGAARPRREMRPLIASPLFHKAALRLLKYALRASGTAVVLPRFEATAAMGAIARHRVSTISASPAAFGAMLARPGELEATDRSSITRVYVGGAPVSDALREELGKYFPMSATVVGYGSTEAGLTFQAFGPNGESAAGTGSVGFVMKGAEVKLVGGQTPDEGVLWIRSPHVMLGYHGRPEETAERLHDGWFDTRDVFRRDEAGRYYFVRRADEMLVCNGENVYPREIELRLERHAAVQQAVVVGVDHPTKGQLPVAFVVLRADAAVTEEDLKAWAIANGPPVQHPRRVFFETVLPRSGTDKVDRVALRLRATEAMATPQSRPSSNS